MYAGFDSSAISGTMQQTMQGPQPLWSASSSRGKAMRAIIAAGQIDDKQGGVWYATRLRLKKRSRNGKNNPERWAGFCGEGRNH